MSFQLRSFALASFSFLALACGSEDPKAQDKCETLVVSYCDRVASCADKAGVLDDSYSADDLRDDCELSFATDAHCDAAVQVSAKYNQCVRDAKALSCDDINDAIVAYEPTPLPTSCEQVILHDD